MRRLVTSDEVADRVQALVQAAAPAEGGYFCLLRAGRGAHGPRLLVGDVLAPPADAWDDQHADMLTPSARWISEVISTANAEDSGLLFVHSHPNPRHPAGFSPPDREALAGLGPVMAALLDGPFAAAIVHPEGWIAAEVDTDGALHPVDHVQALGRGLRLLDPPEPVVRRLERDVDARQADALGAVHAVLRRLHVGVVGAGGLGSPAAEALERMGVAQVTLLDCDVLDTPSNVRRVFGSTAADLRAAAQPLKVDVVGRHLDTINLGPRVRRLPWDVRTERAARELLDCDAVLCTTDTHSSRAVLVDLAYAYGVPVLDVGVRAGARDGALAGLAAEVRVLTPTTPCLWCRGTISADVVREELLPAEQLEQLRRDGYLVGTHGAPEPSVVALTMLGAGLVTCALLALISPDGHDARDGYVVDGFFGDAHPVGPTEPEADCWCRQITWRGDHTPISWLPPEASTSR